MQDAIEFFGGLITPLVSALTLIGTFVTWCIARPLLRAKVRMLITKYNAEYRRYQEELRHLRENHPYLRAPGEGIETDAARGLSAVDTEVRRRRWDRKVLGWGTLGAVLGWLPNLARLCLVDQDYRPRITYALAVGLALLIVHISPAIVIVWLLNISDKGWMNGVVAFIVSVMMLVMVGALWPMIL